MVEIEKRIEATPEEFFSKIEESLLQSIKQATGKKPDPAQLKGFKFATVVRNGTDKVRVKAKITAWEPPERYEARFTSAEGVNSLGYRISALDDEHIEVGYFEEFRPNAPKTGPMVGVSKKLNDRRIKSKAKRMLRDIEEAVKIERRMGRTS